MASADRRLAAIMFTDVVGYTRMSQARESLALELLEEHRRIVRPLLGKHGGIEVKTIGDAFLVEFKSALDAVLCAVEIQNAMAARNSNAPQERKIEARIGIHLGDVVHESQDVYGDAVNLASRIEQLSRPGGVCITRQVYDSIRNKSDIGFVEMGEVELKNVELPMKVYRVEMERNSSRASGSQAPRERLAVLPFVNISPDPNDEYFADGLTEELITKLSEVKGLKVIARTSVMNYKKKEKNVSQIGRELEVGSIIEGSVRKAGNKIRVTVQLIDSRTEEHLWASNYDSQLDDIFAIQSDVAARVANSVSVGFFPAKRTDTEDVDAYTMYIKATQLTHSGGRTPLKEAVVLFDKAIERDHNFVRAYAGLSGAWLRLATGGYENYDVVTLRAEPAARKALELDPGSAEAHAAMAGVCNVLDRFDQVLVEAEQAIKTNPNLADAYHSIGIYYASMGKFPQSLAAFEKALELDPLAVFTADLAARTARVAGKVEWALATLEKMDTLTPMNPRIINGLAEICMVRGDFAMAQELITKGLGISPTEPLLRLNQGLVYALTGRREEAERSMKEIMTDNSEAVRIYGQLFIQSALGNLDEAFRALDRAAELHSWPYLIASLPIFAELRKDSRYSRFASKMGLPT